MNRGEIHINADDLGHSQAVNEAVLKAFRYGTLTSASLMVTGDAFHEAVEIARNNPGLLVGIHLVTVMGRAVLPHREIPHITDVLGRFPDNPVVAGLRYHFCRNARRELFKELEAQFDRFCSTGMKPTHVDSHLHMHVHPVVFEATVNLARHYGVKCMRVPVDDLFLALQQDRTGMARKVLESLVFRLLARPMKHRLDALGIGRCERVFGHLLSGRLTEEYVLAALERLRPGGNEIYFHPAICGDGEKAPNPQGRQGLAEFRILTSPRVLRRVSALRGRHDADGSGE
ncbi:MAG: hopanoid biosynthesis-associated protein HpnK [Deltaproteobacteria bacterium]|nr:hopanoid biosynthesis-associated protein HpnK [Deltaproteobacteria bacterium]